MTLLLGAEFDSRRTREGWIRAEKDLTEAVRLYVNLVNKLLADDDEFENSMPIR